MVQKSDKVFEAVESYAIGLSSRNTQLRNALDKAIEMLRLIVGCDRCPNRCNEFDDDCYWHWYTYLMKGDKK